MHVKAASIKHTRHSPPRYVPAEYDGARTFGIVLDTSGSMDRNLLAKALGAIASYSSSRDVPFARVIFCDATAYDQGYMSPDAIAGRVKVRGRGGTVLQPGLDMLHKAKDFPEKAPILIITDGWCENNLVVRRDHAYLLPLGRYLSFNPKGQVFHISDTPTHKCGVHICTSGQLHICATGRQYRAAILPRRFLSNLARSLI